MQLERLTTANGGGWVNRSRFARRGFPPPFRYAPLRRETSQGIRTDKKELQKCRTGARIRGVKSAEVACGLL